MFSLLTVYSTEKGNYRDESFGPKQEADGQCQICWAACYSVTVMCMSYVAWMLSVNNLLAGPYAGSGNGMFEYG